MMRFRRAGVMTSVGVALVCLSGSVSAATGCSGQIRAMLVDNGGAVQILSSFRDDWVQLCSVSVSWKGISVDLCKSWLAVVTTARISREPVALRYNEDMACNAIPSYANAPAPSYVAIWE